MEVGLCEVLTNISVLYTVDGCQHAPSLEKQTGVPTGSTFFDHLKNGPPKEIHIRLSDRYV